MKETLHCADHGQQHIAIICQHTLQSMYDLIPRGLFVSLDVDGDINAYCDQCENYRVSSGGDWPEDANDVIQGKLICVKCFDIVRKINGHEVH